MYRILQEHEVVYVPYKEWISWQEKADKDHDRYCRVASTHVGKSWVSTVFLVGPAISFVGKQPKAFETMVFGGPMDEAQYRYNTWEEAEDGHRKIVEILKDLKRKSGITVLKHREMSMRTKETA